MASKRATSNLLLACLYGFSKTSEVFDTSSIPVDVIISNTEVATGNWLSKSAAQVAKKIKQFAEWRGFIDEKVNGMIANVPDTLTFKNYFTGLPSEILKYQFTIIDHFNDWYKNFFNKPFESTCAMLIEGISRDFLPAFFLGLTVFSILLMAVYFYKRRSDDKDPNIMEAMNCLSAVSIIAKGLIFAPMFFLGKNNEMLSGYTNSISIYGWGVVALFVMDIVMFGVSVYLNCVDFPKVNFTYCFKVGLKAVGFLVSTCLLSFFAKRINDNVIIFAILFIVLLASFILIVAEGIQAIIRKLTQPKATAPVTHGDLFNSSILFK